MTYVTSHRVGIMADVRYCWNCGETIPSEAEVCEECGEPQVEKSPLFAALLNFSMPGAGYMYLRERRKGVIWALSLILLSYTGIGLVVAIPLWLFGVYSAYQKAKYNFR